MSFMFNRNSDHQLTLESAQYIIKINLYTAKNRIEKCSWFCIIIHRNTVPIGFKF